METLVRCGGCGTPPVDGTLRRGRCPKCYETWVRARTVGVGGACSGCDDRRLEHLRYWELGVRANAPGGRWIVLCHNCVGVAEKMMPAPRSLDGLKMRLARDRRWGDRRAAAVGRPSYRDPGFERREVDRRKALGPYVDDLVVEMEAEYEEVTDDQIESTEEITGIHFKIALPE